MKPRAAGFSYSRFVGKINAVATVGLFAAFITVVVAGAPG